MTKFPLSKIKAWQIIIILLSIITAFASTLPDGLEWSLGRLGIKLSETSPYHAPFADYSIPLKLPPVINSLIIALSGGAIVAALLYFISFLLRRRKDR